MERHHLSVADCAVRYIARDDSHKLVVRVVTVDSCTLPVQLLDPWITHTTIRFAQFIENACCDRP